jgi:hypothetical protein
VHQLNHESITQSENRSINPQITLLLKAEPCNLKTEVRKFNPEDGIGIFFQKGGQVPPNYIIISHNKELSLNIGYFAILY